MDEAMTKSNHMETARPALCQQMTFGPAMAVAWRLGWNQIHYVRMNPYEAKVVKEVLSSKCPCSTRVNPI